MLHSSGQRPQVLSMLEALSSTDLVEIHESAKKLGFFRCDFHSKGEFEA